nr:hypothetical protein [Duganella sp. BJB1802]
MTDLQMSLIGIAGVFVAGVFGYNKIQEYKAKKSVERAFSTDHDDVLMRTGDAPPSSGARHEPSFSLDSAAPGVAGGEASAAAAGRAPPPPNSKAIPPIRRRHRPRRTPAA